MSLPSLISRDRYRRTCIVMTLLLSGGMFVLADSPEAAPEPESQTVEAPQFLAPTLGRPVLIEPGQVFPISIRIPDSIADITFELAAPRDPRRTYPLTTPTDAPAKLKANQTVLAVVPADVPLQTYDLIMTSGVTRLVSPHSVAVGDFSGRVRIVHLSNMNIGDVGAPTPDRRLIDEVNLLAPTLIVATGDYLDVTHPDPEAGWNDLVAYFREFEAPLLLACGDHDDIGLYSRHAAPSPVGTVTFGHYRGLILYDLPRSPIAGDADQLEWLERNLPMPDADGLTFVVTHDDAPNLLYRWQHQGTLTDNLQTGRIGLWIAGGHRDWNGVDYRPLIDAAYPMLYARTHESSTAPRGGASGECHYRVIDVADGKASFPQGWPAAGLTPPSIPVGLLSASTDGPNDGSRDRLAIAAANNHPFRIDGLAFTIRLRKTVGVAPWCHGGKLLSAIDRGNKWECRIGFDLPDKGAVRILCGAGPEDPPDNLSVAFELPDQLRFHPEATPLGLPYSRLLTPPPAVRVLNNGDRPTVISPLVRLDGELLAYRPRESGEHYATAYRLLLNPGDSVYLEIDMSAVRVTPGRRDLQVYLDGSQPGLSYSHTVHVTEAK